MAWSLAEINRMTDEEFVDVFGGIFERSPWVAHFAYLKRPFESAEQLHEVMCSIVEQAPGYKILELIRSHPDLATRLQVDEYSAKEQRSAGLDSLTPEEYKHFDGLNETYKSKFGFPFILAVTGKSKADIVSAMEGRLQHDYDSERREALQEIRRIAEIRLRQLMQAEA